MWFDRRGIGALAVSWSSPPRSARLSALPTSGRMPPRARRVTTVFAYELPNLPGQKMTGLLVRYDPGGSTPPHRHSTKASPVVAYVLEGAIRSKVNDGPETVYRAGENWFEPPGSAHPVSANASATEPAALLAVFVAEDGASHHQRSDVRRG